MSKYHRYTVSSEDGIQCNGCRDIIPQGSEFAVKITASEPYREYCIPCAEMALASAERGLRFDNRPQKVVEGQDGG